MCRETSVLQFSLLGSGSSGNATLVAMPWGKILIDCGLSFRQIQLRAADLGLDLSDLKAVFVTHEHSDHVAGLGVLSRKLSVPLYMTAGTYEALPRQVGRPESCRLFDAGESFALNGVRVQSFSVSHDAADPVSYCIEHEDAKLGIAGDLGHPSELVRTRLERSHALVLEANYCPRMLQAGKYPPAVQQRIRGRFGHLSNQDACGLLSNLIHDGLQLVVLVHISEENNTAQLAESMARRALGDRPAHVHVATKDRPTPLFEIRA